MQQLFPIIIAALNIGASIVYFYNGDYSKGAYWFFACMITLSTIFM